MAYSIVGIEEFEDDYDQILNYLINHLGNRQAALRLVDEMDRVLVLLAEHPLINAVSSQPPLSDHGCRIHHVMHSAVVYTVREDAVVLIGMFHQSQLYARAVERRSISG